MLNVAAETQLCSIGAAFATQPRASGRRGVAQAEADLARVARLTMMGELPASIAREINQPLAAIVMDGSIGLRWRSEYQRNLEEAQNAFSRVVSVATRAGHVIRSLRALVKKAVPEMAKFDINAAIEEVLALARSELMQRQLSVRTTLFPEQQLLLGDRALLQHLLQFQCLACGLRVASSSTESRDGNHAAPPCESADASNEGRRSRVPGETVRRSGLTQQSSGALDM